MPKNTNMSLPKTVYKKKRPSNSLYKVEPRDFNLFMCPTNEIFWSQVAPNRIFENEFPEVDVSPKNTLRAKQHIKVQEELRAESRESSKSVGELSGTKMIDFRTNTFRNSH